MKGLMEYFFLIKSYKALIVFALKASHSLFIFFFSGKFELNRFTVICTACGKNHDPFNLSNIINSGYWFASPENYAYLFSTEVFEIWDSFRKNMPGSSETAFLKSVDQFSEKYGKVSLFMFLNLHTLTLAHFFLYIPSNYFIIFKIII